MSSLSVTAGDLSGELSTDHAASSHGQPVLIVSGQAYGVADKLDGRPAGSYDWQVAGDDPDGLLDRWRALYDALDWRRKPRSPAPKTGAISIRLSATEMERVAAAAETAGETLAAYCRRVILRAAR